MFVIEMMMERVHTEPIQPLRPEQRISEALDLMDEFKLSHWPLVDEHGHFMGLLQEDQLFNAGDDTAALISIYNPGFSPAVREKRHIFEALDTAAQYRISLVPVIDYEGTYKGVYLWSDLLEYFRGTPTLSQPGAVLVVSIDTLQYSLVELAGTVEHNDARILGLWMAAAPNGSGLELTLKLNVEHTSPIVQSMQRYGYELVAVYGDESYEEDYQERFKHLMNYLKY